MKTPYSFVHVFGDFVFAARGGKIHSFNSNSLAHISTWSHPDALKVDEAAATAAATATEEAPVAGNDDVQMEGTPSEDGPPAKRQRIAEDEVKIEATEAAADVQNGGKKKGKKAKDRARGGNSHRAPQALDRPLIAHITSTEDGKHLVVVSGHDKSIWVLEHDGAGVINDISQRKMPKRPIDVFIGPENTIITADKFGDVYSLPLLFTPTSDAPSSSTRPSAFTKTNAKPSATALTVHSKRNRKALEAQLQLYDAQAKKDGAVSEPKSDEPSFEMDLLLGHVSMLTGLALGESEGKKYIITADRDEHIRVSRYIPQAHVVEGFCLGHNEFVASIAVPAGRPDILVSGGGDADLFVWDWKTSSRLSTASVLDLAKIVSPETTKVAVTWVTSLVYPTDSGDVTHVLAICEDIKAIFAWQLTEDNKLNHPSVIQLPGNPLHITTAQSPPRLIIAIDPIDKEAAKSLNIFTVTANEGRLSSAECLTVNDDDLTAAEPELEEAEIRKWLYTTEQLRKQEFIEGYEEAEEEAIELPPTEKEEAEA